MANTPPVPGKINPNAINSTVPPVPGMINPNAINSATPVNNNQNITAGSIGADIFSGSTNTANITKPVDNNQNIATPVNDTPTNTPNSTGSITIGGKLKDQLKGVPDTTPKTITNPTPTSTNINIKDTTKTPTPPTTIDPKIDPQGAINQWKTNGSNINQLETLVENKYGTTATLNGDTLTADINGKTYNWKVDGAGNAIKTLVGDTQNMANNQSISTSDGVFGVLSQGGTVPTDVQNTDAYKQGKLRFDNYSKFTGYTDLQLSTSLRNGDLIPGTNTYNDLQKNPVMTERLKRVSSFNATFSDNNLNHNKVLDKTNKDVLNNTSITIGNKTSSLGGAVTDGTLTANEVNTLTYNPETIAQGKKARDLKTAYQKKKSEYDKIYNDAKKELYGTGATTSMLNKMVANRRRDILPELQQASYEANNALGYYTQLKSNDIRSFSTSLNFYNQQQNRKIQRDRLSLQQNQFTQGQYYNMAKLKQSADIANAGFDIKRANSNISLMNAQNTANKITSTPHSMGTDIYGNTIYGLFKNGKLTPITNNTNTPNNTPTQPNSQDLTSNFIAQNEGFKGQAYQDAGGTWTIGYGTTQMNGVPVKQGDTITQNKAAQIFQQDIAKHSTWKDLVTTNLNDNQKSAIASFEYNLGNNIWTGSGKFIMDAINKGDFKTATDGMAKFNGIRDAQGNIKILPGLTNRRTKEIALFNQGPTNNTTPKFNKTITDLGESIRASGGDINKIISSAKPQLKSKVMDYLRIKGKSDINISIRDTYKGVKVIDEIMNNPLLPELLSTIGSVSGKIGSYILPNSKLSSLKAKIENLNSKNFLTGIQGMKGMGSLSDAEGKKVGAAVMPNILNMTPEAAIKELQTLRNSTITDIQKAEQILQVHYDISGNPIKQGADPYKTNTGSSNGGTQGGRIY